MNPPTLFDLCLTAPEHWQLQTRTPTLDGSIAQRAAQACLPFLEGNAYGFMATFRQRLEVQRQWGTWHVVTDASTQRWATEHRALLPFFAASPVLASSQALWRRFAQTPWHLHGNSLELWTGIWLRAKPSIALMIAATTNRRNLHYNIATQWLNATTWQPLILEVELLRIRSMIQLRDQVASLLPICRATTWNKRADLDHQALHRHFTFFDASYFAQKERAPTRRYKRLVAAATTDAPPEVAPTLEFSELREKPECVIQAAEPGTRLPAHGEIKAACDVQVDFDGYTLHLAFDEAEQQARAQAIQSTLRGAGPAFAAALDHHAGAWLYFAKYMLAHQRGEAHFFAKPAALIAAFGDALLLVEGQSGRGYQALRGILRPHAFSALPIVMEWQGPQPVQIAKGSTLAQLWAIRESWLKGTYATYSVEALGLSAWPWSNAAPTAT